MISQKIVDVTKCFWKRNRSLMAAARATDIHGLTPGDDRS
jgi:hypothetical protein